MTNVWRPSVLNAVQKRAKHPQLFLGDNLDIENYMVEGFSLVFWTAALSDWQAMVGHFLSSSEPSVATSSY